MFQFRKYRLKRIKKWKRKTIAFRKEVVRKKVFAEILKVSKVLDIIFALFLFFDPVDVAFFVI